MLQSYENYFELAKFFSFLFIFLSRQKNEAKKTLAKKMPPCSDFFGSIVFVALLLMVFYASP